MIDLSGIPVVDNHCHPYRDNTKMLTGIQLEQFVTLAGAAMESVQTELLSPEEVEAMLRSFTETSTTLGFTMTRLARFLGTSESIDELVAVRNKRAQDYREYHRSLYADADIDTLVVEDGYIRPRITLQEFSSIVPVKLKRVLRLETVVRELLETVTDFSSLVSRYQDAINEGIKEKIIGLKSLIAYRTGLDIQIVPEEAARKNFEDYLKDKNTYIKPLRDYLTTLAMDMATEADIFMHFHTGGGDADVIFNKSNPGQLFALLHDERYRRTKVVLLHAGHPWVSETAFMATILPYVYVDSSLLTPFGGANARSRYLELLELCPYSKILYGSDAGEVPEGIWSSVKMAKLALGRVLSDLVGDGFLTQSKAYEAAEMILYKNAYRIYGLG